MSKDKLIPELRFPEFLEKEGWEIKEVGEIFQVTRGYVLSMTLVKELPTEDYPYPVFSSQTKNNGLAGYYNEYLYEDAITWTTDGANAGDVNYRDGKFYCTNVCGVLLNEEGIANPCIAELINSVSKKHVSYVGNPKLMNGVMSKIQIPVPSIKEQQKIASCLSSLDEVISAHSQKLDLLKDHKKGLMQNLFPQEGETVPRVRFPEFEGDGEWELKPLEELCKLVRGPFGGALKKEIFVEEGYAVYEQSHAIYSDFRYFRYRINEEKYNELKRFSVRAGDLIMSCSGTMGKFSMIPDDSEPGVINQALLKLSVRNGNDIFFVKTSLETDTNQRKLLSQSAGGAIKNVVSVSQIRILELAVPKMREQQKIASCLSAVDELITSQQEKIDQLQQHKKGMMQGLFPKIND